MVLLKPTFKQAQSSVHGRVLIVEKHPTAGSMFSDTHPIAIAECSCGQAHGVIMSTPRSPSSEWQEDDSTCGKCIASSQLHSSGDGR